MTATEVATELRHLGLHDWASHTERNGVSATLAARLSEDLERHNEQRSKTKPDWLRERPDRWAPRCEALIGRLRAPDGSVAGSRRRLRELHRDTRLTPQPADQQEGEAGAR